MDAGQAIYITSQLLLGAVAAFLAIFLWPKIRDAAWMLIIFGIIVAYVETVYSILKIFGINADAFLIFDTIPLISFILPTIRMLFFISAFIIMIYRQTRQ
ncbi:MAG: hypothetical protein FWB86_05065 [Treponema sp.]|nr:hypothetical protein [Treponema sp.]MCL2251035.1 hypothetical protein [Treponema sp.]